MSVPLGQMWCPPGKDIRPEQLHVSAYCGENMEVVDIDSDGEFVTYESGSQIQVAECCYTVEVVETKGKPCAIEGRPYYEGGRVVSAAVRSSVSHAPVSRRALAWEHAGAAEHASVAAFARLSLQLMAHGAPLGLLRDVHRAAVEEVGHAERCWALARHFGACSVGAGPFPFAAPVSVDVTLPALAADAVREGCLAETLGAHLATVAAELAPEPEVRAELSAIAAEESEHAVLSFRIVAWALAVGGTEVLTAVRAAFAAPWPNVDVTELALRANVDEALLRQAAAEGVAEVLEPARDRLLAA